MYLIISSDFCATQAMKNYDPGVTNFFTIVDFYGFNLPRIFWNEL